jgi:hypothetical protein
LIVAANVISASGVGGISTSSVIGVVLPITVAPPDVVVANPGPGVALPWMRELLPASEDVAVARYPTGRQRVRARDVGVRGLGAQVPRRLS